jgi:hypothetical protein
MKKPALCSVACLLILIPGVTSAQLIGGRATYPQMRGLSMLPGGGFGVTATGNVSPNGALAISSPIAYSLKSGQYFVGFSMRPQTDRLFEYKPDLTDYNGYAMAGLSTDIGNFTFVVTTVSRLGEPGLNVHWNPIQRENFAVGVGVQDVFSDNGSAGAGSPFDNETSRSIYAVVTVPIYDVAYISGGWGTRRFDKGFVSASVRFTSRTALSVEHDGFNWNAGLLYALPLTTDSFTGEMRSSANFFLGTIRGKSLTFGFGFAF